MTRCAALAAIVVAALVPAASALAANTGSISVWHTPMTLASSQATTIHVTLPQSDDPIAAIDVYSGAAYSVKLGRPAGTTIGSVDATVLSRASNLTLPLSGQVVTAAPSSYASQSTACAGTPASAAVWILNLSVAGQVLALPVFVNPTSGPEQALGGYRLSVCLTPWDIPESAGGAPQGAQLLDVTFTVNGVFTTPTSPAVVKWETLFTPYSPGVGTVNRAGTFEARAFVPLPIVLGVQVKTKSARTGNYVVSGKATEGGAGVRGLKLAIARGTTSKRLAAAGSATTSASGAYAATGRSKAKTLFFQVTGSVGERDDTAAGCASPLTSFAPAGCVKATLSPWHATSVLLRLKR